MRLAYLISLYPKVSHTFIRREILALERQGFEVQRVALRGWDAELVDREDVLEQQRTRYLLKGGFAALLPAMLRMLLSAPMRFLSALGLAIRVGWRSVRPLPYHLAYFGEACRMLLWLRSANIEHLHAHFGTNSAEVAMIVRALGGPPYSFTVHRDDELAFGGVREKVRRAAFVVAVSSFGRSQLYLRVEPSDWPKVKVVHCGLEPGFHDVPPVPLPQAPRLVCVGRLCAEKGQLLLLEAARRVSDKGVEFELVLAGDGEMRAKIEEGIARYDLSAKVRVTGWIASDRVRDEILAARAMVLPSFLEGLPVAIMEAMALRRPVLATYVGGIPELVLPGKSGWLFPAGSVDDLAAALEDCLSRTAAELAQMGEAGFRRFVERHAIDTEAGKLGELFRRSRDPGGPG